MNRDTDAKAALNLAARVGLRGWGRVEPNPMVGCVLVRPAGQPGEPLGARVIGIGHHRRIGGLHAEAEALANARARGHDPAGATAYCTLEPCAKAGKQPACTGALIQARVARVVCATADPTPGKGGGAAALRAAGIAVEFTDVSPAACELAVPWLHRARTGLPWVIAKWAQSIDGKIATRTGESQWISGPQSRRWVHLTRARVDAVLTGIGTVLADDPRLTARDVPVRRVATRVVIDPGLELPPNARLLTEAGGPVVRVAPVTDEANDLLAPKGEASSVLRVPGRGRAVDLRATLAALSAMGCASILTECGPGLTSELLAQNLINELHVYIAPTLCGDDLARSAVRGLDQPALAAWPRYRTVLSRRCGTDIQVVLRQSAAHPGLGGAPLTGG